MKNKIGKQQKLCVFIKESNWKMTKPSETDNNFHFAKTSDESVKPQFSTHIIGSASWPKIKNF